MSAAAAQPIVQLDELHAAGGVYYKGFVNTVKPAPLPSMSAPETIAAYDPWESVRVEWDVTARDEDKFQVLLQALEVWAGRPSIVK